MSIGDFKLIAKRSDGTRAVSNEDTITHSMDPDEVHWVHMIGECQSCSAVNILKGDFEEVGGEERGQGAGSSHSSKMRSDCEECGEAMRADAEFSEYPEGPVHLDELNLRQNVEYIEIYGLERLFESQ